MNLLRTTKINIMQWRNDPKYVAVAIYTALYLWNCLHGVCNYAAELGTSIHPWLFPFLLRGGSIICPLMLGYIILISDAPFRNRQQCFILLRVGKVTWLTGQILYLFMLSLIFTVSLFLLSILYILPQVEWSTDWGNFLITIAVSGLPGKYGSIDARYSIIKDASPIYATAWTITSFAFVCFLLGMIVLLCNLWLGKGIGVVIVSALAIFPKLTSIFQSKPYIFRYLTWISPLNWADRSVLGHTGQNLPSYTYGLIMPIILSVFLVIIALRTIHRCNLDTTRE